MTTSTGGGAGPTAAATAAGATTGTGGRTVGRGVAPLGPAAKVRGAAFADVVGGHRRALGAPALGAARPAGAAAAGGATLARSTAEAHGAHGRRQRDDTGDDSSTREGRDARERRLDPFADGCDPMARHAAQMGPPGGFGFGATAPLAPVDAAASHATARARTSIEDLLPSLVKRIAWSGDGKRGTVRMELGAGALEGSTMLIHADGGRVRVELTTPPGTDASAWRARIVARLGERGIDVESVDVS